MAQHSLFGNTTLSLSGNSGGATTSTTNMHSRATQLVTRFNTASVVKARRYIPAGASVIGSTITLGVYVPATSTTQVQSPTNATVPTMTASATTLAAAGWNEVTFASPVSLAYDQRFWVVGYQQDMYPWPVASGLAATTNEIQALDSSQLFIAANGQATAPINRRFFSCFDDDPEYGGPIEGSGNFGDDGLDVVVEDNEAAGAISASQTLYIGDTLIASIPTTAPSTNAGNLLTKDASGRLFVGSDASKASAAHTHTVADITTTGTASSATYLRGDATWAEVDSVVGYVKQASNGTWSARPNKPMVIWERYGSNVNDPPITGATAADVIIDTRTAGA